MVRLRRPRWKGSRRRFLQLSAGAASSLVLAACNNGSTTRPGATSTSTPRSAPVVPTATPRPTTASGGAPQAGGTLRFTGLVISDGQFDPHKTQAPPLAAYQSMTFSRLLTYESQSEGIIGVDLATTLPETPDPLTYVVHLNPAARWDERAPLEGRPVSAADIAFSIERQRNGDGTFVRRSEWLNVESVQVLDPTTLILTMSEPLATMTHRMADVHSFVVAPEAAEQGFAANIQLGSGPFRAIEWNEQQFSSAVKREEWYGGGGRPYLDGLSIIQPTDATEVEAELRTKKLDVAFVGKPVAERLRRVIPDLNEVPAGVGQFFGMRFFSPHPPFHDPRVRSALSYSIDRREMIREFFSGAGEVNPWVSWPLRRWSLPQSELATFAGYRPGVAGRNEDIAEAAALLAAFRSDQELDEAAAEETDALSNLVLYVVDEAEATLGLGSFVRDDVQAALGLEIEVVPLPLSEIIGRLLNQEAPWVTGPDSGWIDLDDWVFPYFHSAGTRNSFALRDPDMDTLIEAQRVELDNQERRDLGYDIQRRLLSTNVGTNFASERVIALAWPYVHAFPLDATDGFQGRLADCWLDPNDKTYLGR